MSNEMETNSEVDAVYGDWLQTGTDNDRFDSGSPKELISYPEYNPLLLFHGQITSHAALVRTEVFEKIGSFNAKFKVYGDREFMLRFAVNGYKAKKISEVVGLYLKNPNGLEFTEKESGDAEFKELLDRFLLPEYFVRLFDGDDIHRFRKSCPYVHVCRQPWQRIFQNRRQTGKQSRDRRCAFLQIPGI